MGGRGLLLLFALLPSVYSLRHLSLTMPSTFSITLPGDTTPLRKDTTVTLGPGLQQSRDTAVSTAGGVLHNDKDGESLWVDAPRKRVGSLPFF